MSCMKFSLDTPNHSFIMLQPRDKYLMVDYLNCRRLIYLDDMKGQMGSIPKAISLSKDIVEPVVFFSSMYRELFIDNSDEKLSKLERRTIGLRDNYVVPFTKQLTKWGVEAELNLSVPELSRRFEHRLKLLSESLDELIRHAQVHDRASREIMKGCKGLSTYEHAHTRKNPIPVYSAFNIERRKKEVGDELTCLDVPVSKIYNQFSRSFKNELSHLGLQRKRLNGTLF